MLSNSITCSETVLCEESAITDFILTSYHRRPAALRMCSAKWQCSISSEAALPPEETVAHGGSGDQEHFLAIECFVIEVCILFREQYNVTAHFIETIVCVL